MIPKVAHFYWDGQSGAMSDLRARSMESFRRVNPDWSVAIKSNPGNAALDDVPGLRGIVLRSDYARYEVLATEGGFYFDTDFIFIKPVPEYWLTGDVALSAGPEMQCVSVANLGASADNRFFRKVLDEADRTIAGVTMLGHQSLGTELFKLAFPNVGKAIAGCGLALRNIPYHLMLPIGPDNILALWSAGLNIVMDPETVAVHWYGGDRLSNEFERDIPKGCLVDALVSQAGVTV